MNYVTGALAGLNLAVNRWGGDATTEYNWSVDKTNVASDWFFEVFAQNSSTATPFDPVTHDNSGFDLTFEANRRMGMRTVGTIPITGWVAGGVPDKTCSYSVKKYGAQQQTDQWAPDCGNGTTASGQAITWNDPTDADVQVEPAFMTQWVQHVVGRYGTAAQGGVAIWEMDNEPVFWNGVHQNIHPNASTFDEVTNDGLNYAQAVKAADPTAAVAGPITSKWDDLFFSAKDIQAGYGSRGAENWKPWNNPIDREAHGNLDFVAYYLQQFAAYEKNTGQRLLDYLDIHAYVPGAGMSGTDPATNAMRLEAPRVFWDTNFILYNDPNFNQFSDDYLLNDSPYPAGAWTQPECVCLIPRMKNWVAQNYPGTKLAITEYNLGEQSSLNGGLAQADVLGVFGREGLDLATLWATVNPQDPAAFAYKMYRNYDGNNSAFGTTSVLAESADQSQLSIYGAQRDDGTLTIMVINKTGNDLSSAIALNHFEPAGPVQVWQYGPANLAAIVQGDNLTASRGRFFALFPANSITLLVAHPNGGCGHREGGTGCPSHGRVD